MRRTIRCLNYLARYRWPTPPPHVDGPPPKSAPQTMNTESAMDLVDPIDDPFPLSIRGSHTIPDVPGDQYVNQFYVLNRAHIVPDEYTPWRASAPEGSFRFRASPYFDRAGRATLESIKSFEQWQWRYPKQGMGSKGMPFRDALLSKMNGAGSPPLSLATLMDREVHRNFRKFHVKRPLEVQRDTGRIERPLTYLSSSPVKSIFPFFWNVEDWHEYEITKARLKRFNYENTDEGLMTDSEVTYKIVITTLWDHHAEAMALDMSRFLQEVGRQIIEEKITVIRHALLNSAKESVSSEVMQLFNRGKSPFNPSTNNNYSPDEIRQFFRSELINLEAKCSAILGRINSMKPEDANLYDSRLSWPVVERLEPWTKMVEFWGMTEDNQKRHIEESTKKYEFRRFFRVIKVKLPFQSSEFEKRMYDTRHWLHKTASVEFHTLYKKNVVFDESMFPVERDPLHKPDHEHHRLFSFALDWQSAPYNIIRTEVVRPGDNWESMAQRLGTSVSELVQLNGTELPAAGTTITIPVSATKKLTSMSGPPRFFSLVGNDGQKSSYTLEQIAQRTAVDVAELLQYNSHVASVGVDKELPEEITQIELPPESVAENEFVPVEPTFENDTFESVAARLGTTVEELQAANPSVKSVDAVQELAVPSNAKFPRRLTEPLLRRQASTASLFSNTVAELKETNLPVTLPEGPDTASQFPAEYRTESSQYPPQPMEIPATNSWINYTCTYLDPKLTPSDTAASIYNKNELWPENQVPGTLDSTPFEEDQTWFMHDIPLQDEEIFHPEGWIQDLEKLNNEQFAVSLEWEAP